MEGDIELYTKATTRVAATGIMNGVVMEDEDITIHEVTEIVIPAGNTVDMIPGMKDGIPPIRAIDHIQDIPQEQVSLEIDRYPLKEGIDPVNEMHLLSPHSHKTVLRQAPRSNKCNFLPKRSRLRRIYPLITQC